MSVIVLQGSTTRVNAQAEDIQTLTSLGSLSDVTITSLGDGEVIRYNSLTGQFENATVDEIAADLTEIDGGTY